MSGTVCQTCKAVASANDAFCGKCGNSSFCCGSCFAPVTTSEAEAFCGKCGNGLNSKGSAPAPPAYVPGTTSAPYAGQNAGGPAMQHIYPAPVAADANGNLHMPQAPYVQPAVRPQAFLLRQDSVVGRMPGNDPPPQLINPEPFDWHLGELFCSLMFFSAAIPLTIFGIIFPLNPEQFCPELEPGSYRQCGTSLPIPVIILLIFIPYFLTVCCGCRGTGTMGFLRNLENNRGHTATELLQAIVLIVKPCFLSNIHLFFLPWFQKMVDGQPTMQFSVRCWHTERRTSGSGKNRSSRTVTVTTFTRAYPVTNLGWMDVGGDPSYPQEFDYSSKKYFAVNVKQETSFDPIFQQSMDVYKAHLYQTNCHRDTHCSVDYSVNYTHFQVKLMTTASSQNQPSNQLQEATPFCLSPCGYTLLIMCVLTWPYNLWFEGKNCKGTFTVKKRLVSGIVSDW